MSEDKIVSISSASNLRPEDIVRKSFTVVKRGFDPDQIRFFLEQIAAELGHLIERENRLRQQIHEMQVAHEKPAEVDEETITRILGEETAKILSSAREAARDLLARTSAEASETKAQAQRLLDQKLQEAESEKSDILESANRHYNQVIEQAESEKEALLSEVKEKCRLMVSEAQIARERILGDLIRKRRVLNTQVEQLRTGKDVILDSLTKVKDDIENLSDTLVHIEREAKYAAEQSGLRVSLEDDPTEAEMMKISESMDASKTYNDWQSTEKLGVGGPPNLIQDIVQDVPTGKQTISTSSIQPIAQIDINDKIAQDMIQQVDGDDDNLRIIGYETIRPIQPEPITIIESVSLPASDSESTGNSQSLGDLGIENEAELSSPEEILQESNNIASPHLKEIEPTQDKTSTVENIFKQLKQTQIEDKTDTNSKTDSDADPVLSADEEVSEINTDSASVQSYEVSAKELTEGLVVNLIRKVKRAINDEQNELLDGLRKLKNSPLDSVMNKQLQSSNFFEVISPILIQAEIAGKEFSKTMSAESGVKSLDTPASKYQKLADEMANLLTNSLRQKVSFDMTIKSEDDKLLISEELSSAYREWKNEKIETVAADFIYSCFNSGIFSSFDKSTRLTWLITEDEPDCPDCQDNALQRLQNVGEQWPTGQLHPPAHPGCRCILAVDIS